jgi:hypothetical protein
MKTMIAVRAADGAAALWEPTSLDQLGKYESYLETALSETPELLCLETKRTGVYQPFAVFNQLSLVTPQGRTIAPDIVLLAASGDVVIVEVKLFANPELRDRRVIAQAIDYASSLSALTEDGMARLFNGGTDADWATLVSSHFPDEEDPEELAAAFLRNAYDGNVHIVVACDKAPKGVYELAKSVSAQSHLSFSLDVVEVTPYVSKDGPADAIMFVPNVRLSTEIVARTAVTVSYEQGVSQPGVTIETTGVEEIAENLASAAQGQSRQSRGRDWTDREIEDIFLAGDEPVVRDLFLFAKQESYNGQFQSKGRKVSAAFNFYARVRRADGSESPNAVFQVVDGASYVRVYMNWAPGAFPERALAECRNDLKELFGDVAKVDSPEPTIPLAALDGKLEGFEAIVRKLRDGIETSVSS